MLIDLDPAGIELKPEGLPPGQSRAEQRAADPGERIQDQFASLVKKRIISAMSSGGFMAPCALRNRCVASGG